MDVEFHYYMTHLIAARAGFGSEEAETIAYACQHTDDNDMIFEVSKDTDDEFRNYISQTMNILKPKKKLMRVYMCFHFVPGTPTAGSAERKDGEMHWLNTTPGNRHAEELLEAALETGDLYRIGIGCHAYGDSWAHQNFIGYYNEFNALRGVIEEAVPNIGHADAGHHPDRPALIWQDRRLLGRAERVDNTRRFLQAAAAMFTRLRKSCDRTCSQSALRSDRRALRRALSRAIGGVDMGNHHREERIVRYLELAAEPEFGGRELPRYDPDTWFEAAIDTKVRLFRDRSESSLVRWDPLTDRYSWRDPDTYRTTDWYRFQLAVKAHQKEAFAVLGRTTAKHVQLDPATF